MYQLEVKERNFSPFFGQTSSSFAFSFICFGVFSLRKADIVAWYKKNQQYQPSRSIQTNISQKEILTLWFYWHSARSFLSAAFQIWWKSIQCVFFFLQFFFLDWWTRTDSNGRSITSQILQKLTRSKIGMKIAWVDL